MRIFQANVLGSFHLFEAAAAAGVRRLIFASSGEVYPERSPAYLPVDEHHLTRPGSYYGMTKLLGEEMAWFYARKFKIPTVVLRFEHTQDAAELLDPDSFFPARAFFFGRASAGTGSSATPPPWPYWSRLTMARKSCCSHATLRAVPTACPSAIHAISPQPLGSLWTILALSVRQSASVRMKPLRLMKRSRP